mgnify:CR=1 FL=1|tara:strand:- start:160 stop:639 length:480 start_codon:yes stop_codon:yes gene_type:complete
MSRTRRTPQELIEEQEARLDKLKEKAALDAAKDSPELAQIVDAIAAETSAIQEAQRGLGSSPQSFQARLDKHYLWIAEIQAAAHLSALVLETANARKAYLSDALSTLSETITEGSDVSVEVLSVLASIPTDEGLMDAKRDFESSHAARKAISATKKKEA